VGTAAYTSLAVNGGTLGWPAIAVIMDIATAVLHPAVRAAQRHLEQHALEPVT